MNKLENASSNIEEMAMAVCKGQTLQAKTRHCKEYADARSSDLFSVDGLECFWRIKPDAFDEVWELCLARGLSSFGDDEVLARYIWNAAMEHKDDENN